MSMIGPLKLKAQLLCDHEIAMGPGKADLLDAIAREGSISAAGRAMAMSYRRTWLLVDTMNRCWAQPLVHAAPGRTGGARLTPLGEQVLARYRALQHAADTACRWDDLDALLLAAPRPAKRSEVPA